ncbi:class I SAM-dependent methyltransferase [Pseudomonas putida]|uniref:class I SAM-dependent methyltransferase n=1 Tax=Pseudomonas putida TaxID=303 RepID=UPI000818F66A|nr:class I SAM-dependent methyltransferase [Pseudomonas putida]OCT24107.1 methyltransferase [Pseudomonas putida]OCT27186.1 methyltransferase [Pseudomonas putida]OCT28470.1 methyltransferase [Pseudomonas putida]OCT38297.1 methyltransferase [Pseudomonas putida]
MSFSDPTQVADYGQRTTRIVPALHDLHKMTGVLLTEHAGVNARVLVLGAGGGLELKALATQQPGWRFTGVDPSREMLDLAQQSLGPQAKRVDWHQGYIDSAETGPFDAATCLLTLHFLPPAERLATLRELHRRLRPGAPLVVAHHSIPDQGQARDRWLARNAAFATASGVPASQAQGSIAAIKARLPLLTPEQDAALLHEAGFSGIEMFYCALTFKGWVAYRA